MLKEIKIALFAIDEAHCISQWGHDFRPEYQKLNRLCELFPDIPRIALTATADRKTQTEIIEQLNLEKKFISSFDRPNIKYTVNRSDSRNLEGKLLEFIRNKHPNESGIVYCLSRKKVESVTQYLIAQGFDAVCYHAGLSAAARKQNQDHFLDTNPCIVVATIAFGMGIDKPNVRFVAHLTIPKSLEAYYQETGRAGRDGQFSDAWMYYNMSDIHFFKKIIEESSASERIKALERDRLRQLINYLSTSNCRRKIILKYFNEDYQEPCSNCDNCGNNFNVKDYTNEANKVLAAVRETGQRFGSTYLVDFLVGNKVARITQNKHDSLALFGSGSEHTKSFWFSLINELSIQHHLSVNQHGSIIAVSRAPSFSAKEIIVQAAKEAKAKKPRSVTTLNFYSGNDNKLFEQLKQWRKDKASQKKIPSYCILSDKAIHDLIKKRPKTEYSLMEVNGIGIKKLHEFGSEIINILHCNLEHKESLEDKDEAS